MGTHNLPYLACDLRRVADMDCHRRLCSALSDEVLVWLSVWSDVLIVCIWPS